MLKKMFLLTVYLLAFTAKLQSNEIKPEDVDKQWKNVEASIQKMTETMKQLSANDNAMTRYDGYRAILGILTDNYVTEIYSNRAYPEVVPFLDLGNHCGPGGDFKYSVIQLEEGASYRFWGRRGDAQLIDFQQQKELINSNSDKTKSIVTSNTTFDSHNIPVDENGYFDVIMSAEKPNQGGWFKLDKGTTAMYVREMFSDYKTQNESGIFHLEKIGETDATPSTPEAAMAVKKLNNLARGLDYFEFCMSMPKTVFEGKKDNEFSDLSFDVKQLDQRMLHTRFNLGEDEALIGEWEIPEQCEYWNMTLYTDWWQHIDLFNRQTSLNSAIAHKNSDKTVRFVMSHKDPGIQNWLDLNGYQQGIMIARAKQCPGAKMISSKVVPVSKVKEFLPTDIKTVTQEQRSADLKLRREHFRSIFRR